MYPTSALRPVRPVALTWDAELLADEVGKRPRGQNMEREDQLLANFPPYSASNEVVSNTMKMVKRPAIITDLRGRILAWALPEILSLSRQVCLSSVQIS